MTELKWYDFLEIGVDFIDDDHKKLLSIMQATKQAIEAGDNKKCTQLLTQLLKEAREHFAREEQFLADAQYPGLQQHKKYHKELLIKADTTKRICEGIETDHDLKACFNGMADFLIDDILRGDVMFKSHLEFKGYIKGKERI